VADHDDHRLAVELADAAGALLLELRQRRHGDGATERQLKDEGDRLSNDLLLRRLHEERPDDAVLSEEGKGAEGRHGTGRLQADRVWIIDPLDGTREFGEVPRDDWAVHVALVEGGQPTAAAVALPAQGRTLSTLDPAPTPPPPPARPRIVVSRTRPPQVARYLAARLDGELVPLGSAGAKAAAVVTGAVDLYPHAGGQFEWDSCAPVGVARAAGLWCSRLDLSDLRYNRPDPYLPDLLVAHPALVDDVRAALADWDDPGW
jgi:3'(2'), 5'-bisphosphate nucleotidase